MPDDYITRQDMMVMTGSALEMIPLDLNLKEGVTILAYNDVTDVSDYAYSYCNKMVEAQLIQGYSGNLMPEANTTRGKVVVYLNISIKKKDFNRRLS